MDVEDELDEEDIDKVLIGFFELVIILLNECLCRGNIFFGRFIIEEDDLECWKVFLWLGLLSFSESISISISLSKDNSLKLFNISSFLEWLD